MYMSTANANSILPRDDFQLQARERFEKLEELEIFPDISKSLFGIL